MDPETWTRLPNRDVIAVGGDDARPFLQGLVTNDIDLVSPARSVYAALLTPQGKFLHDFFVVEHEGTLLVECDGANSRDLARRLRMYRLRAAVDIRHEVGSWAVIALPADTKAPGYAEPLADGVVFADPQIQRPRLPGRHSRGITGTAAPGPSCQGFPGGAGR